VTTGRAASARSRLTIRFDPDGSTAFERVEFSRVNGLDKDALECIRQTISAREIQVRRVDVTMLGFPAETTLETFRTADLRISADGPPVRAAARLLHRSTPVVGVRRHAGRHAHRPRGDRR